MALTLSCNFSSPADPPACVIGVPYSHFFSASGGSGNYIFYSFYGGADLNGGLSLDENTGELSGIPDTSKFTPADFAQGFKEVGFWVFVLDGDTLDRVGVKCGLGFYLNCLPLTPSCNAPPGGTIGLAYSHSLSAIFGIPPYTWALTGGALPDGLSLAADGTISGIPTTNGLFTFFATATGSGDPTNNVEELNCQISIGGDGPSSFVQNPQLYFFAFGFLGPLDISCGNPPLAVLGSLYSHLIPIFPGSSTGPYTFTITAGALCLGLTLDALTGLISGIPEELGTFPFTVQVEDDLGATAEVECSITVVETALSIVCDNPPAGKLTFAYLHEFPAEGGTPPYVFSIVAGELPPGLSLNAVTGVVSGIPTTPGVYEFTIRVTDANDFTDEVACSIVIKQCLLID